MITPLPGTPVLPTPSNVANVLKALGNRTVVPQQGDKIAEHVGATDLPYIPVGEGSELKLLHVDLNVGLWISMTRFQPGVVIAKHFHTGPVYAVTLSGAWYYREYPDVVNRAGSYLFEPAGSVHTLMTPEDAGVTEVWFAIHGSNVLMDDAGQPTAVVDARYTLDVYRAWCAELGHDISSLIVVGE